MARIPATRIREFLHVMMIALVVIVIVCALAPRTALAIPGLPAPTWP